MVLLARGERWRERGEPYLLGAGLRLRRRHRPRVRGSAPPLPTPAGGSMLLPPVPPLPGAWAPVPPGWAYLGLAPKRQRLGVTQVVAGVALVLVAEVLPEGVRQHSDGHGRGADEGGARPALSATRGGASSPKGWAKPRAAGPSCPEGQVGSYGGGEPSPPARGGVAVGVGIGAPPPAGGARGGGKPPCPSEGSVERAVRVVEPQHQAPAQILAPGEAPGLHQLPGGGLVPP